MNVIITQAERTITRQDVSAVGVGHLRKDLVLVYPKTAEKPESVEEVGTDWVRLIVER